MVEGVLARQSGARPVVHGLDGGIGGHRLHARQRRLHRPEVGERGGAGRGHRGVARLPNHEVLMVLHEERLLVLLPHGQRLLLLQVALLKLLQEGFVHQGLCDNGRRRLRVAGLHDGGGGRQAGQEAKDGEREAIPSEPATTTTNSATAAASGSEGAGRDAVVAAGAARRGNDRKVRGSKLASSHKTEPFCTEHHRI